MTDTMTMTQVQIEEFLASPRHAVLATKRRDGAPQISPVWYLYDQGRFYISASVETAKHHNVRRDPRLSLCIDGCHPDARAVVVHGSATVLEPDDPQAPEIRWRIIRRYYETEEDARRYVETTRGMRSALLIVTPEKMISQDFN
jgi:PPOX class probable F420-dependent enzyme